MKNATEFAKKFKTFRKKLPKEEVVYRNHGPIGEVIYSHLLWNATAKQANTAYEKLMHAAVDMNDLRMNHVFEIVEIIGVSYPQAEERAKRLKSVLNAIYKREHNVTLDSLEGRWRTRFAFVECHNLDLELMSNCSNNKKSSQVSQRQLEKMSAEQI